MKQDANSERLSESLNYSGRVPLVSLCRGYYFKLFLIELKQAKNTRTALRVN